MVKIEVYILKHSSPFGKHRPYEKAFIEKAAAQAVAKRLTRQFHTYKIVKELAEPIPGDRVLFDMHAYNVDRSSGREALRQYALSKLSKKDIEVLELSHLIEDREGE